MITTAIRTQDPVEKLKRCLALFVGAMIVIGAQAAGVSFASFAAESLYTARVASTGAVITSSIFPALIGLGMGYFIVWQYKKSEAYGLRIVCFVGMLALAAFIQVYAVATNANGVFLGVAAVPNLAFAAGVTLVFVFSGDGHGQKSDAGSLFSRLRIPARLSGKSAGTIPQQSQGTASAGKKSRPVRDPFDF